jgi:hypothetical protein
MNTCGDCPRRPAEAALLVGARKGVRAGPLRWKAPRAREGRRIDVLRRERVHATEPLARRVQQPARHVRPSTRGVRGFDSAKPPQADKAAVLQTHLAPRARAWQPIGPKPASRRQAWGCWRPDDRKVVRRRPRIRGAQSVRAPRAISMSNVGGFPTALGGQSPEVMFVMGARGAKRRL